MLNMDLANFDTQFCPLTSINILNIFSFLCESANRTNFN